MTRPAWKSTAAYAGLLAAAFLAAVAASVQPQLGEGLDHWAYDFMFRTYEPPAWQTQSAIIGIDESTLQTYGGVERLRGPLASALHSLAAVQPKAIAIDVTLADPGIDPGADASLAAAFAAAPRVVLASDMGSGEGWEDPLPIFRAGGAALGQVHTEPDSDGITRAIALEKRLGRVRRWALALEAFRLSRGAAHIVESPQDLEVGGTIIPIPRKETDRTRNRNDSRIMRVRYIPADRLGAIPRISLKKLVDDPSLARLCAGKVVFVGLTAVTALHDRLQTPVAPSAQTAGVEINADAFETMAQGLFLIDVAYPWVLLFSLALVAAAGLAFRYLPGAPAYVSAVAILILAGALPYAKVVHGSGCNVLVLDPRGEGGSEGHRCALGALAARDVSGAVRYLLQARPRQSAAIFTMAISQNCEGAVRAAREDSRIRGVVLDSPLCSATAEMEKMTSWAPAVAAGWFSRAALLWAGLGEGCDLSERTACRDLAEIGPRPVLLICPEDDALAKGQAEELYGAAREPVMLWKAPGTGQAEALVSRPVQYAMLITKMLQSVRVGLPPFAWAKEPAGSNKPARG